MRNHKAQSMNQRSVNKKEKKNNKRTPLLQSAINIMHCFLYYY